MCSIFLSKGTKPFDFIKRNVIQKSAYKVKCIIQINGVLVMFGQSFYKISWLDCEPYGKNQYKKGTQSTFSVLKVLR